MSLDLLLESVFFSLFKWRFVLEFGNVVLSPNIVETCLCYKIRRMCGLLGIGGVGEDHVFESWKSNE